MEDKKTCLYDRHISLNAKMVPFGGFVMPLQYSDIADEHIAVRTACGVFDVSHMGEVLVTGPEAERFAVDGISMTIPPKKKIAFVGPSGGGKTQHRQGLCLDR